MPGTLELCEKYFDTSDVYELLEISKDALDKDIKKAYYKLSLKVHPDRVAEQEKEVATEKFKVLSKIYEVLTDKNRKALYDEKGIIDDDDEEGKLSSWLEIWRTIFKPITKEDIGNYEREYIGSELEKTDIKKAYLNGKGCIDYMMNCVPFMAVESEPRIAEIVQQLIDAEEVPEYKAFTRESAAKTAKRHKKYAREKKQSEKIAKKQTSARGSSLEQAIMKRQQERGSNVGSFFDKLLEKYGEEDDENDVFSLEDLGKKKKKKKPAATKNSEAKPKDRKVRAGRVAKKAN